MALPIAIAVTESSQVGEARRAATALAARLGFNATDQGRAALIVTEAANNIVKHARDGTILLRPGESAMIGIEILALDKGAGILNLQRCLRDGYSTAGSPGTGLGAIVRLAATFDLHSSSAGTALLARLWDRPIEEEGIRGARDLDVSVVSVPLPGEDVCGDAWGVERRGDRDLLLVADGLGHGPLASAAALAAVQILHQNPHLTPANILREAHRALRGTRGAAVSIAEIDRARQVVLFAGVGNVAGAVVSETGSRSMVSHNGTLGYEAHSFQEFSYPFPHGANLIMHSDGLGSRWKLDAYAGLPGRDPALIAGVLYRDFRRGRDDVTVLVAREKPEME